MFGLIDARTGWVVACLPKRPRRILPHMRLVDLGRHDGLPAEPGAGLCVDLRRGVQSRFFVDHARNPNLIRHVLNDRFPRKVDDWWSADVGLAVGPADTLMILLADPKADLSTASVVVRDRNDGETVIASDDLAEKRVVPVEIRNGIERVAGATWCEVDPRQGRPSATIRLSELGRTLRVATPRGHALTALGRASARVKKLVETGPEVVANVDRPDYTIHVADAAPWLIHAAMGDLDVLMDVDREGGVRPFFRRGGVFVVRFHSNDQREIGFPVMVADGPRKPQRYRWLPADFEPVGVVVEDAFTRERLRCALAWYGVPARGT